MPKKIFIHVGGICNIFAGHIFVVAVVGVVVVVIVAVVVIVIVIVLSLLLLFCFYEHSINCFN